MRRTLTVLATTGTLLLGAGVAAAVPAQASAPKCSFTQVPKLNKVVKLKRSGVRSADKKHKYGWLSARRTRVQTTEEGNQWFKPYGKERAYTFAKKNTICVVGLKNNQLVMKRVTLAGLRKAAPKTGGTSVAEGRRQGQDHLRLPAVRGLSLRPSGQTGHRP